MNNAFIEGVNCIFSNKVMYKVAILSMLLLAFGILSNGGNLVQAQVNTGTTPSGALPPPSGALPPPSGALPPPSGALPPPSGALPPPSGALPPPGGAAPPGGALPPPGGVGTITTPTAAIPSNNVTALYVYDNSTMVLEFGNGTTLASPYSNVWRILFSPASNQIIGNIPPGVGAPPGGAMTPPPPPGGVGIAPPVATTAPPVAMTPPLPPPGGGVGTITTPTAAIPSNNVTALHVYDNSTMVLEFGNGTTLASPYSKVWRISFSPASNQIIGNIPIPPGVGAPPGGAMTPPPPPAVTTPPPPGAMTPPPGAMTPPPPPGGVGIAPPVATTPPPGGA